MKTPVSLGGAERQRNTGGTRSSRVRADLHKKLRKLDRKIGAIEHGVWWVFPELRTAKSVKMRNELDQQRKEVRHLLKSPL